MRRWLKFWRAFDVARVVPRAVLGLYLWHALQVSQWFLALKDPSAAQASYPAVVWGVLPLLLNFYMSQGVKWEPTAPAPPAAKPDAVDDK